MDIYAATTMYDLFSAHFRNIQISQLPPKCLMLVAHITMVAYKLHPPYHRADGEETQHFRSYYSKSGQLLSIGISDAAEHCLGTVCV